MTSDATLHRAGAPDYAVPPGETIREHLDGLGMTQRELAKRLGLSTKHLNQLIQGLVPLSAEIAQRLELVTGMPARLWNRLEADYRSALQRLRQTEELKECVPWLGRMPVRQLIRAGALPREPVDDISRVLQLLAFFGVAHLSTWRELYERPAASFRQTKAFTAEPGAVAAWLRLGELAARDVRCAPFSRRGLQDSLPGLRSLTTQPLEIAVSLARDICARHGVAVVFVEEITGTHASGATKWLTPDKAMLLLSLRYKRDDHLWFTFFHEIGHILLHEKSDVWIEDDVSGADPREEQADRFAADLLIPADHLPRLHELRSLESVKEFAHELGIAPGIVVGRLQHEGIWPHRQGNGLKRKIELTGAL
ncbi:ImmA/IrrE family metallo-endopeptidase [Planomonospora venezuelensis]|uniref:HTH-type transcriptional regulator/antitoxin HigA n=1 Tax=Planomonospora venezuelensis TaxID=1999 RepID=A0A841CTC2_PLAVE|nr:ImmA/IrrE family metallo-endopeptidase [Planomonospora venezuelensis]MBB5961071.1 HTH-type transcriptional regulator/antitoxin HigA [Planomonospora venezuelensis]GIN04760.1 XRE family transcriptional regulator [Planomonospora venezuelensis]